MQKIVINRRDYYLHSSPETEERTKKRLMQIAEMGMEDFGNAQFGFRGTMSGLYIEKLWSYSEKDWDSYMQWANQMKTEHYSKTMNENEITEEDAQLLCSECGKPIPSYINGEPCEDCIKSNVNLCNEK